MYTDKITESMQNTEENSILRMGEQLGGTALESTVVNVSAISIIKGLSVYKSLVFISRVILLGKSWRMLEGYDRLSVFGHGR